jgi:hypothetical protein
MIVPTSIVDSAVLNDISPLVFRHEYIEPISYAPEWSPVMLKDYVLFMIDFIAALDRAGLGLNDPSAYNATFYGGKFIYIDYSGIYWKQTPADIFKSFVELHVNPLVLITKNAGKGYFFLKSPGFLVQYKDIAGYLSKSEQMAYSNMLDRFHDLAGQGYIAECCAILKEYIEEITNGLAGLTDWAGYQDSLYDETTLKRQNSWTAKQRGVISMIRQAKPRTMIDLAGNMGWYGIAMSGELDYAITADYDAGISDKAYEMVKRFGVANVLPLFFDLIAPTPAYYRDKPVSTSVIKPYLKSAVERFRCDIAIALAVVHHLTLSQGLSFEGVIGQLALFTNKHLIIEFCNRDDEWVMKYLRQYDPIRTNWYTKERFERVLCEIFNIVTTIPSDVDSRTLYLCEKR